MVAQNLLAVLLHLATGNSVAQMSDRPCDSKRLEQLVTKTPKWIVMKVGTFTSQKDYGYVLKEHQTLLPVTVVTLSDDGRGYCVVAPSSLSYEWSGDAIESKLLAPPQAIEPGHFALAISHPGHFRYEVKVSHPFLGDATSDPRSLVVWNQEQDELNNLSNLLVRISNPKYDPLLAPPPQNMREVQHTIGRAIDSITAGNLDEALQLEMHTREIIQDVQGGEAKWRPALESIDKIVALHKRYSLSR